jgi:hypothetical protein
VLLAEAVRAEAAPGSSGSFFFRSPTDSEGSCGCEMVGMGKNFGEKSGFGSTKLSVFFVNRHFSFDHINLYI